MNKLQEPVVLWKILAILLAVFMLNFPFVQYPELVTGGPTWLGLDVSWQVTLNYALVHDWVWGKDIIYTYGPLGFLATRFSLGISRWVYLLFDLFVVCNFYFIFKDFIAAAANRIIAILIIFFTALTVNANHAGDISWVIMLFIYYWLYKSYKEPEISSFIWMGVNIVLCFYIKLNAGLIGVLFLGAHLVNLLLFKRITIVKAVSVFGSVLLVTYLASLLLHVHLPGYINGAFEIIKGYNDVMYLEINSFDRYENIVSFLFYGLLTVFAVYAVYLIMQRKTSQVFFVLISVAYIFLLRKQAAIRNDVSHYVEFIEYGSLILLVGNMQMVHQKWNKAILFLSLLLVGISLYFASEQEGKSLDKALAKRYGSFGSYVSAFISYNEKRTIYQSRKRYIPKRIINKIGNATVDVFPWDSEYIIENRLNYTPRPVFQSFSAYTEQLQNINYEKYRLSAPEFIIYDYDAIDQRYPFNDDLSINLFICKNYTFADSFSSNGRWRVLLQKKEAVMPLSMTQGKVVATRLKTNIPATTKAMKIEVKETFAGKLQSLFYRAQAIRLQMNMKSGVSVLYRTSKELLKAGILTDKGIVTTKDFVLYMNGADTLDVVESVAVVASDEFYEKEIQVQYINVK